MQAEQIVSQSKKPVLSIVETPQAISGEEALKNIRQMLNDTSRSPAHLYNKVLSVKERTVLCFAAGLTRSDISQSFEELSENSRIELHKAILLIGKMYAVFSDANVLSRMQFINTRNA